VTVVENAPRILAVEEPEAGHLVGRVFAGEGIEVLTEANTKRVSYEGGRFELEVDGTTVRAERLLVATGRRANLSDIGLESVGLDPSVRMLEVDGRLRAADGLWAIGDITGKGAFTHVSMYQAAVVVRDVLGEGGPAADYRAVTRVTFTEPEVASVGLTEEQARDQGLDPVTAIGDLGARGWLAKEEGLIKVVADPARDVLVGATVVGSAGGEVLSMLALAVHAETPLATLRTMHYAYPTFHRAVESVLKDL
jgi:pyruvate/2-oxoglutarate dehydrogenase complex dihydrolipoamide dehydrogenase (E3) component